MVIPKKVHKKLKAFTLIELLVAIAIVAIMTAIVVANFSTPRARARDAKRVSDIAQLQLVLTYYFDRCNQYPSANYFLQRDPLDVNEGCPSNISAGTFISRWPNSPSGVAYRYHVKADRTDYVLEAIMENAGGPLDDDVDNNDVPWLGDEQSVQFCEDQYFGYCVTSK